MENEEKEILVSKVDDNTLLVTAEDFQRKKIEKAMLNFTIPEKRNIQSTVFSNEGGLQSSIINIDEIDNLALNPQTDINKIIKINNYVRYMINKNDILGKVYETVEGNINTDWELNSAKHISEEDKKIVDEVNEIIENFLESLDIERLIAESLPLCYIEGNYIMYLRKDIDNMDFQVDYFPIGVAEISDYKLGGEHKVVIDVHELRSRLNKIYKKNSKNKPLFYKDMDEEIKSTYPKEVYEAYDKKERYAILDIKNSGILRVNNFGRKYGVSPIFRALKPALRLDNIEEADDKNTNARGKKIIFQKLSPELMKDGAKSLKITWAQAQATAHDDLITALQAPRVSVYTGLPWTESVEYVEPKIEQTNVNIKNQYRNDIMTSVGISFLNTESSSYSSNQITIKELAKSLNKITAQLEKIVDKWIKNILSELDYDLKYAPKFKILSSALLEDKAKLELATFLFDKMGASFSTVYSVLGRDINTEIIKRKKENEDEIEFVFSPRANAYNSNGNDLTNEKNTKPSGLDGQEVKNIDKTVEDKDRNLQKAQINVGEAIED